jgi:hypothetical protein
LKRVAEVWLNDYKKYLYRGDPLRYAKIDVGDLRERFELKIKLNYKPFKYFVDTVTLEMLTKGFHWNQVPFKMKHLNSVLDPFTLIYIDTTRSPLISLDEN